MTWLLSLLSAILCAAAGTFIAGWIADKCVRWYRISNFEGGSGYYVVAIAIGGMVAGFVLGLIASRYFAGSSTGFAKGLGAGLASVVIIGALSYLTARAGGDVPPTLEGRELTLLVELACPQGWKPANRVRYGGYRNTILLTKTTDPYKDADGGSLGFGDAREEAGAWILPAQVRLLANKPERFVHFKLNDQIVAVFQLPLPANPGHEFEKWSDWLSSKESGYRCRFRIQRDDDGERDAEWRAAVEAKDSEFKKLTPDKPLADWLFFIHIDEHSAEPGSGNHLEQIGTVVRSRPLELAEPLRSRDPRLAAQAMRSVLLLNELPPGLLPAFQDAGTNLLADIREYAATYDPDDPNELISHRLKDRCMNWSQEWDILVQRGAAPPDLLPAIIAEASKAKRDENMTSIAAIAESYREKWKAAVPGK